MQETQQSGNGQKFECHSKQEYNKDGKTEEKAKQWKEHGV